MNLDQEFPSLNELIFVNHAGISPLPARVARAMREFIDDFERVGPWHYPKYRQAWIETHGRAARLLGCDADEIALVKSTTAGLMMVAGGLEWKPGDVIISAEHEFPANYYPWASLKRRGVEIRRVPERNYGFELEDFARAIDERTRLVTVSAVQYSTGFRMPLAELGKLCRERGVLFCVDGIQALGAMPFHVREWNIDFLSADGHKWMLGPEGLGIFYCRRDRLELLSNNLFGWMSVQNSSDYETVDQPLLPDARRFEEGSQNLLHAAGLNAALGLILEFGVEEIERRILALTQRLINGLWERECEIFTPLDAQHRLGIVSFRHPSRPSEELFRAMLDRRILAAARRGWVRVSPHFYNTEEQIDAILKMLD